MTHIFRISVLAPGRAVSAGAVALIALWALVCIPAFAGAPEDVALEVVASGLSSPVALTHAGDDRLFVTLQAGQIVIVRNGSVLPQPFLDIDARVRSGGERGLLSAAFHPRYSQTGFFFVNYTRQTDGATVIARYSVSANPDQADGGSERVLLVIDQPFSNHNGGQLQFGSDGMLYIGMGDGGSSNDPQCYAQRESSLLGKMLRLDVDQNAASPPYYGIPVDNPFVGFGDPADEVWSSGLRNPWRFSFDRTTGDLLIGDVGQRAREEIDWEPALTGGRNYGWKVLEGELCLGSTAGCLGGVGGCGDPRYTGPILTYNHSGGRCSVTGGYVYRGSDIAELQGGYIYGDFCSGQIWAAERSGANWTASELPISASDLSSFGEDREGELYVVQLSGTVSKLVSTLEPEPEPGSIEMTAGSLTAAETDGQISVTVRRFGGSDGAVSIRVTTSGQTAMAGADFEALDVTVDWLTGELGSKTVAIVLIDDGEIEAEETFLVSLGEPTGGVALGRSSSTITIVDDDRLTVLCVENTTTLCLNEVRFEVLVDWRDFDDRTGLGQAVPLTADSGYYWFFNEGNVELVVKVLDACDGFDRYWVFATGLTNVYVRITVRDTESGQIRQYENQLGAAFEPILDVAAFATCP